MRNTWWFRLPLFLGLSLSAWQAAAQPSPRYAPVLVSDPPAKDQQLGSGLAIDPAGNFVATWTEQGTLNGGSAFQVFARRMAVNGVPLSGPIAVSQAAQQYSMWPSIGADALGNFVLSWGYNPARDLQSFILYTQRFNAAGTALGLPTVITPPNTNSASGPRLAVNAVGDHAVVWYRISGNQYQPVAQVFDAQGTALSPLFDVPVLLGEYSQVAGIGLTADRRVVIGSAVQNPQGGFDIRLQCYATTGTATAAPVTVATRTDSAIVDGNGANLTLGPDGVSYLAWPQTNIDNGQISASVVIKSVASDCVTVRWISEANRASSNQGAPSHVKLAVDRNNGGLVVGWSSRLNDSQWGSIRRFSVNGAPLGDASIFTANHASLTAPELALRGTSLTAVWSQLDLASSSTYLDVYAQGFDFTGAPAISVNPSVLDYGRQRVRSASAAKLVTVTNTGTAPLRVGRPGIGGANAPDFAIQQNGCTAAITPNSSCSIAVVFTPGYTGSRSAALSIPSDAPGGTRVVGLKGSGHGLCVSLPLTGTLLCIGSDLW